MVGPGDGRRWPGWWEHTSLTDLASGDPRGNVWWPHSRAGQTPRWPHRGAGRGNDFLYVVLFFGFQTELNVLDLPYNSKSTPPVDDAETSNLGTCAVLLLAESTPFFFVVEKRTALASSQADEFEMCDFLKHIF